MSTFYLYGHDGSANHGCEAIVRTTVPLLNATKDRVILVSGNPDEDKKYGLDKTCTVFKRGTSASVSKFNPQFALAYFKMKLTGDYKYVGRLQQLKGVNAQKNDIALAIGGDTYCYGSEALQAEKHTMWKSGGLKTIYWGCSIEPKVLADQFIVRDIKRYNLITARESISYEALRNVNPNTVLVADTAFLLDKKDITIHFGFGEKGIIGINCSPLIERSERHTGIVRRNYKKLIEYIIANTEFDILLIPHVVGEYDDDRLVLNELYNDYQTSNRVLLVDDNDCMSLKGYISKCKFFIGARTHATIAAYSTLVPTLVLGYSVKSRGIARDLFGEEKNYVLPIENMYEDDDLVNGFIWLLNNELSIKDKLQKCLPKYIERIDLGIEKLREL